MTGQRSRQGWRAPPPGLQRTLYKQGKEEDTDGTQDCDGSTNSNWLMVQGSSVRS